jgi:hypothetical protein
MSFREPARPECTIADIAAAEIKTAELRIVNKAVSTEDSREKGQKCRRFENGK